MGDANGVSAPNNVMTPAQVKFMVWLEANEPAVYQHAIKTLQAAYNAKQTMAGLGEFGEAGESGESGADTAAAMALVGSAVTAAAGIANNSNVLNAQLALASKGLNPMLIGNPSVANSGAVIKQLTTAGVTTTPPWLMPVLLVGGALAALMIFKKK
jgi:hypothetical protein